MYVFLIAHVHLLFEFDLFYYYSVNENIFSFLIAKTAWINLWADIVLSMLKSISLKIPPPVRLKTKNRERIILYYSSWTAPNLNHTRARAQASSYWESVVRDSSNVRTTDTVQWIAYDVLITQQFINCVAVLLKILQPEAASELPT